MNTNQYSSQPRYYDDNDDDDDNDDSRQTAEATQNGANIKPAGENYGQKISCQHKKK